MGADVARVLLPMDLHYNAGSGTALHATMATGRARNRARLDPSP